MKNEIDFSSEMEEKLDLVATEPLDANLDGYLSNTEVNDIISEIQGGRSLGSDLADPTLFTAHEAGDYTYVESGLGKSASGVLEICDNPVRDASAQRSAGGVDRRPDDDGGHLIGARYGGSSGAENLDAQNRQLNRGQFKALENGWADQIADGDKVFVDVETFKGDESDRPSAFMGYAITEHPDGSREWDSFSFPNESAEQQENWGKEIGEPISDEDLEAAIADAEYSDGENFDMVPDNSEESGADQPECIE